MGDDADDYRLSEEDAEQLIGAICFKTGPPGTIGAELEWLVSDATDPSRAIPLDRIHHVLKPLEGPGVLPGAGQLTVEPGGQVELSTAPAGNLADCVAAATSDLAVLDQAFGEAGLVLSGHGIDPLRPPRRVLELPRYAAMERYFDRGGHWGRLMMCSTASVQVCVDAGLDDDGTTGYTYRWRLLHALGPVLVAAFANSPLRRGVPTGWKCTRQLVWARLDPSRTAAPRGAEPGIFQLAARQPNGQQANGSRVGCASVNGSAGHKRAASDVRPGWPRGPGSERNGVMPPRSSYISYAMDADVLCVRQPDGQPWAVPAGLSFRQWLRGNAQPGPTAEDLNYHLSTLFPPVRPRGHLELRMIDAQPGEGWMVPVAVVSALADDPVAAEAALEATEPVWHARRPGETSPWLRAARHGLSDPVLAASARLCFEAAEAALARAQAPPQVLAMVADFAERYVRRGRCPADDVLDCIATAPIPTVPTARSGV